ncbi:MAG: serine hydrolase [Bacteroidota bacterium]
MRLVLLALAVLAAPAFAQTPLTIGIEAEGTLTSDGAVPFSIELEAGQFVYGEADQRTVDVVINVAGPDGMDVVRIDQSGRGPEPFTFTTSDAGTYTLTVTPFERESGDFALAILRAEPEATTPEGRLDQSMAAFDTDDRPGAIVAVIRDGEVDVARTYGQANLAHGLPITRTTRFNIGSVSKQFAGVFFALMAEEGRLTLDDDVRTYLPELPDFGTTVTLRHLLNHTSGYREVYGPLAMTGRTVGGDILDRQDAIDVVMRQPDLQFAPGSRHLYNSTAYVLLTTIAERIVEQPYPDWMDEHVFGPLGMTQTAIEREPGDVIPNMARSYTTTDRGTFREDFEAYSYYGATDVYTTVDDLATWMQFLKTGDLGNGRGGPGVIARMTEKSLLTNGDTLDYTLGLTVSEHLGLTRYSHGGATGGYRAFLAYYPEIDAGLVLMGNIGAVPLGPVANEAPRAFFADDLPAASASVALDDAAQPVTVNAAILDGVAGTYLAPGIGLVTFARDGDALTMTSSSGRAGPLVALNDSTFRLNNDFSFRLRPGTGTGSDTAEPYAALLMAGRGTVVLNAAAPAPDDLNLEAYTGRYFSEELETFYDVVMQEDMLTIQHRRLTRPLRPVAADVFSGTWPLSEIDFERDAGGEVVGFTAADGRSFGIRFERVE